MSNQQALPEVPPGFQPLAPLASDLPQPPADFLPPDLPLASVLPQRPAQHYAICYNVNFIKADEILELFREFHKHNFEIWPNFTMETEPRTLNNINNINYKIDLVNSTFLGNIHLRNIAQVKSENDLPDLYAPEEFCSGNMSSEYLFNSLTNKDNFTLIGYNDPDRNSNNPNEYQVHSILTFSINRCPTTGTSIYVDAFCVNAPAGYKGGGYLLKTLIDICVSNPKLNYIRLNSVDTPSTIDFYNKMGFTAIGPYHGLISKERSTRTERSTSIVGGALQNEVDDILQTFKNENNSSLIGQITNEDSIIILPKWYETFGDIESNESTQALEDIIEGSEKCNNDNSTGGKRRRRRTQKRRRRTQKRRRNTKRRNTKNN